MDIDNDINNILNKIENKLLLWDNEEETNILIERVNISFKKFILIYKSIESQYIRFLKCIEFEMENNLDKIVYNYIISFMNTNKLYEKYKIMLHIDNMIIYNIIYN